MFPTSLWLTQHQCPRQKLKKQQRHKTFFFFFQHRFNVGLAERNCMEKLTIITWLALWDWCEFSTWRILSTQNVMCNLKTSYAVAWFSETGFKEFYLSKSSWSRRPGKGCDCALKEPCPRYVRKETSHGLGNIRNLSRYFRVRKR